MPLGLFPSLPQNELTETFTRIVEALKPYDYASTWSIPSPGKLWHITREIENIRRFVSGGNNAFESSAWSALYRKAFAVQKPDTIKVYETFHLGQPMARGEMDRLIGADLVRELLAKEILVEQGSDIFSRARVTGFDPLVVVSDTMSFHEPEKSTFVFCGRCSSRLAEAVRNDLVEASRHGSVGASPRRGRSLDLCTGSGIQALNASPWFEEVWGGDINPRAVSFARANAASNGITHARFVESNLFANIEGTFDLITANTPFLLLDEGSKALDGYGGKYGMEVELRIFAELDRFLRPHGSSLIVASSAFVDGRDRLEDSLREMFGGKPYAIDLFPISQYYSRGHYKTYEKYRVEKCVLYVVRTRKDAAANLELVVHPFPALKRASFDVKVRLEREIARRNYLKSQAEIRA